MSDIDPIVQNDKIKKILQDKGGIRLDIGCGASKNPGFVGIDYEQYGDVDIVHNIEITPWPLPDECVLTAVASHVMEHITPHTGDSRLQPLIDLLVEKNVITQSEAIAHMGHPGPAFLRVMDEIWRIMKVGGQYAFVVPYAESHGMHQDPTHINFINETTMCYFDPLDDSKLYQFYKPKPWKIERQYVQKNGLLEVMLRKRAVDELHTMARNEDIIDEAVGKKTPKIKEVRHN
jgi:hypothetical protein